MNQKIKLPEELQSLVSWSVELLGDAIKTEYGLKTYNRVEALRLNMKDLRKATANDSFEALMKEKKKMSKMKIEELSSIATSFSFMLELINRCENAYRAYKLDKKTKQLPEQKPYAIIMVLTAHPTEARSPELLEIYSNIQKLLIPGLEQNLERFEKELYHLILLGLKVSLARRKKPTIADEAKNIYSYILRSDILESLIDFSLNDVNVSFRAWVGGDKDGHPGVDEVAMLASLNLSRKYLIKFIQEKLKVIKKNLSLIQKDDVSKTTKKLNDCLEQLKTLYTIAANDGRVVTRFKKYFRSLSEEYQKVFKDISPGLEKIERLLWIFPAMVVPLEVREDSEVVASALTNKSPLAIERMLKTLKKVSNGYKTKWYARGFILSMVESHTDIINGLALIEKVFKKYEIPVVPLFENEKALTNARKILVNLFELKKGIIKHHIKYWGARYEVMVGYSDSSKENGVFPSRLMISNALKTIETILRKKDLTPVFFHGSGGSIERGGGSIKEQTRWWPKSAINIFKATIQGEMVARSFGNENIFSSQIVNIVEQLNLAKSEGDKSKKSALLKKFSDLVRENYSSTIQNETFFDVIDSATPYSFLSHLKIGSRPSKRATGGDSKKLRAIPWILCWTQTRVLFPTWWGTGSSWKSLTKGEQSEFRREYKNNPLVSSFMNALGFTLAKVELGIWKIYLEESKLSEKEKRHTFKRFQREYNNAKYFFREVTGQRELLWFRPWLQESINYRSSMIHPLNLIQLEALKRGEINLLTDTVTGISCGMLTTG